MKFDLSYAGIVRLAVTVIAVAMALYHMWAIGFGSPEAVWYRGTHLAFALVLLFLIYRRSGTPSGTPTVFDYLLIVLGLAPILHLFLNYEYVVTRIFYIDELTPTDMIMGTILGVIVLEATRRVIGWTLPLTAIVFLLYGFFVAQLEPMRFMDQLYMTTEGIFGIPLSVSAAYVLIFVLFGAFMERTGTGQLFMDFAMALTGHAAGGPGKVSVFSSSLFGTISGSAVANVMVDGPITIPLMKRSGFPPHFAAGVESVASTGGQIMPPIMGAAAFVMAEFIGVGYGQVIIWALIPAILYYLACFSAVHFEAKRRGIVGVPRSELPRMGTVLRERGHLFIPVLIILFVLYSGYSAPMSALAGTLACFPVALLRKSTRGYVTFMNIIEAMRDGARNCLPVALACACAGIVIAVVTLGGLGIVFTQFVIGLAQDTLLLALVLTMLAGIVLGMGMPTTPAYIIMTALLVPAIIKLGVVVPAAHMFAFYFAILSAITPPVALAVFAAAGLAKADLWPSGLAAVKIGFAGFIVPFMFVYEPALLMIGDWPTILASCVSASVGVVLFAGGLHGYFLTAATYWQRALLLVGGLLLIKPGIYTDLAGAAIATFVIATQVLARRAAAVEVVKQVR
ncbi:MAG: TRAP transporter fused permease subunit [Rhizobiales bacterium]|nr:TRAP transporter fused permease subunit [Hyphomicrobiales bacterium]